MKGKAHCGTAPALVFIHQATAAFFFEICRCGMACLTHTVVHAAVIPAIFCVVPSFKCETGYYKESIELSYKM